jgi:hypothetical protein
MSIAPHKLYPPVVGLRGDGGENEATLVAIAVLDPSPNYPDCGRIIVGSPTMCVAAGEADIGGWSASPESAVRVAETLLAAAADVDAALDAVPPLAFRYGVETAGGVVPSVVYELSNGRCDCCCEPLEIGARTLAFWEWSATGTRVALLHAERCPTRCADRADRELAVSEQ